MPKVSSKKAKKKVIIYLALVFDEDFDNRLASTVKLAKNLFKSSGLGAAYITPSSDFEFRENEEAALGDLLLADSPKPIIQNRTKIGNKRADNPPKLALYAGRTHGKHVIRKIPGVDGEFDN